MNIYDDLIPQLPILETIKYKEFITNWKKYNFICIVWGSYGRQGDNSQTRLIPTKIINIKDTNNEIGYSEYFDIIGGTETGEISFKSNGNIIISQASNTNSVFLKIYGIN